MFSEKAENVNINYDLSTFLLTIYHAPSLETLFFAKRLRRVVYVGPTKINVFDFVGRTTLDVITAAGIFRLNCFVHSVVGNLI